MEDKFTLETAQNAQKNNSLKSWAIAFLDAEGRNKHLAKHLEENNNLWIELLEFPISKLRREMGPEKENLVFSESKKVWNRRIQSFVQDIKNGYVPAPLIATDFWDDVHLADGSHRHEALLQAGFDKYWTVFFIKEKDNKKWVLNNI